MKMGRSPIANFSVQTKCLASSCSGNLMALELSDEMRNYKNYSRRTKRTYQMSLCRIPLISISREAIFSAHDLNSIQTQKKTFRRLSITHSTICTGF